RGCGETGTLLHCWWECKLVQPLWKTVWRFLRKLTVELPYDPAIALLGIYPKWTFYVLIHRVTCTPMLIAVLPTIAKLWKGPKCPSTNEWIKMWFIYTIEYYLATRKNEILPFAAMWMELEYIMLSEISQSEKDRYHMFSLTCET
ncbi:LORF2 protein, partial [Crocuta crocuta]